MYQLSIAGKVIEVPEDSYLNSIRHLAKGYIVLAEAYHNYHVSGFADWKGTFQLPEVGQSDVVKAIADQIRDNELSMSFNSMREHLQELIELDREIVDWLARYVDLSTVHNKKGKAQLERRLKKIIVNGSGGNPKGPIWAILPEYQAFIGRSKNILITMKESEQQIDRRVEELLRNFLGT
jgi:hypothetical protein